MSYLHIPHFSAAPADYPPAEPAINYSFKLDVWQQYAVSAIHAGHNVLVTAKTGSGKTLVGEYQIAYSLKQKKRVFYTTPIKSLTNQKYHDLKVLFPSASVGIMTGDIKSNPEADIVVMTTEILRNLLFKQSTSTASLGTAGAISLEGVGAVVFDEVHYINDPDRGHVWEETLILLPKDIRLILLSATIDDPEGFAGWLGAAKETPCVLLKTSHRIVPLIHGVWDPTTAVGTLPLRTLKAGDEAAYTASTYSDWLKGKEARLKAAEDWGARVSAAKASGGSIAGAAGKVKLQSFTHQLNQAVQVLQERDLLPALFFVLSRKDCERYADQVNGSLLSSTDTAAVKHIISFHLHRHAETLNHLPQYGQITRLLERGIAFHHSGLLPLLKEIVELLFAKGLVRVLFCTETFAVGLNMPTRTVVFLDLKKPAGDGADGFRPLRADEYIQMAGRAGRRGKDKQGVVIYLPARQPVEPDEMRGIMTGPLVPLQSRLQFHYDFILKALHASQASGTPLWNAVIDNSYWALQTKHGITELKTQIAALAAERDALPLSTADAAELESKRLLEAQVKASVNAARRKAQAELDKWKERHAGPKWASAEKLYSQRGRMDEKIATAEAQLAAASEPSDKRVAPILAALEEWGAVKNTGAVVPEVTPFGTLATEINEGNPLLIAKLYESGLLKEASLEEIVGSLGAFIVDRESLDKSCGPYEMPAYISNRVKSTLCTIDDWAAEGVAIDRRHGIASPEDYWCLATYWVMIGTDWLRGAAAGELATKYDIYEGNLMRGLLKLANLMNEWIALATYKADVDMLEKCKDASAALLHGIAQPESLYLRL